MHLPKRYASLLLVPNATFLAWNNSKAQHIVTLFPLTHKGNSPILLLRKSEFLSTIIATHGEYIFIPSIVLGELIFGFMKGRRQQFNERKLQQIISRLKIGIIDVNVDVARKYAIIYLSLEKKGAKIPINDVWIAACCMEVGGTLLTRDKHFKLVDQIESIVY